MGRVIVVDLLLPSAGSGGAEMHGVRLINHLDRRRFRPRLLTCRAGGSYEKILAPDIPKAGLAPTWVKSSLGSSLAAIRPLRARWEKETPDVVLSFLPATHAIATRALRGLRDRPALVLGVQNNVDQEKATRTRLRRMLFPGEPDRSYAEADAIVALSHGVGENFRQHYPELGDRLSVIHNIGCEADAEDRSAESLPFPRPTDAYLLVACGRLERQKDYPTMLEAVARVRADKPVELWILGRGKLDAQLRAEAARLGIAGRVRFLGFQSNPFAFMAAADVFVLSSAWEGFGNVIVEAMASGAPVVATDCPFGPAEILDHGAFGRLVPMKDPQRLADEIARMLQDRVARTEFAARGKERARDFLPGVIVPRFEGTLVSAVEKAAANRLSKSGKR